MKETLDYGIIYHVNEKLDSHGYVDFDFVSDKNTWRSIKENMFFVVSEPVFWKTK